VVSYSKIAGSRRAAGSADRYRAKEVLGMLEYDVAKFMISERISAASQARLIRDAREARARRPLRAAIGHRLVRFGLRLAAAQG
jgi:hypothetical protein